MNLLYDAKRFYDLFFDKGVWSDESANDVFMDKEDSHLRIECVKFIYRVILQNNEFKEIRYWISTHDTIEEVANRYKLSIRNYKNKLYEFVNDIGNCFNINNTNMLIFCIMSEDISKEDWTKIYEVINNVKLYYGHMLEDSSIKLDKDTVILKLPKVGITRELNDKDFEEIVNLLEPYLVSVLKMNQLKLNKCTEQLGYLNYLLDNKDGLNEIDIQRKEMLLKLINNGKRDEEVVAVNPSVKRFADMSEEEQEKLVNNNKKTRIQF